jgi:hypothetical protein
MYKFLIVSICFNDLSIDRYPYQGVPAVWIDDGMTGPQQVSSPGGWRSEGGIPLLSLRRMAFVRGRKLPAEVRGRLQSKDTVL